MFVTYLCRLEQIVRNFVGFIHHFLELFLEISRNNETARNNEIAGYNEIRKYQDFLQNLREIAFAHQCAKTSKFRAIFTRNGRKSLRNFCTIFVQKMLTGNHYIHLARA